MDEDDALSLRDVAATALANRKLLVMLASLLIGEEPSRLDHLQDMLMEEVAMLHADHPSEPAFAALVADELLALAKLFDPSLLPSSRRRDPG